MARANDRRDRAGSLRSSLPVGSSPEAMTRVEWMAPVFRTVCAKHRQQHQREGAPATGFDASAAGRTPAGASCETTMVGPFAVVSRTGTLPGCGAGGPARLGLIAYATPQISI